MTISPIAPGSFALQLEALTNLHTTGWFVLVCHGGGADVLGLALLDKPMLVVEADPEKAEELYRQLAEQNSSAVTVYCELLGPDIGETRWYCYNDARQNGTMGLEAMQAQYPNLRLQSQGPRRLRRLDEVLTSWEDLGHSAGNGPLEGPGALLALGVEALPLLQGGGSWLERFSTILVPKTTMEPGEDLDTWQALLKSQCLQPSAHIPQTERETAWILLEQDRERLLEIRLQMATDQISTVEANRDELVIQQQELTTQRDSLSQKLEDLKAELDVLKTERNALLSEQLELTDLHNDVAQQLLAIKAEYEALKVEHGNLAIMEQELINQRGGLSQQLDDLKAKHGALKTERDDFATKKLEITTERDYLTQQLEALRIERDAIIVKYQEVASERDELKGKRDVLQSRMDGLVEVIQTSHKQLASFKSIFSGLIVAHHESNFDK